MVFNFQVFCMRPKIAKSVLASLLFFFAVYYVSYVLKPSSLWLLFLSSPFNIVVEQHALYNMYFPAILIFVVSFYLKNFNKSFLRKCSLRAIFLIAFAANYIEGLVGYVHYGAIPLGTSVITLSFIAAFLISLEVYVERKEHIEHLYSTFLFSIISVLVLLLAFLVFLAFFTGNSTIVHAIGIAAFLPIFIAFYERKNIERFARYEETEGKKIEKELEVGGRKLEREIKKEI